MFATSPAIALKRLARADAGELEGLASAYGTLDRHGDVVLPGAFSASIEAFAAGALVLPLLLEHVTPIGSVIELRDAPGGLIVRAQLALGTAEAARVFELAKAGAVPLSVAFTIPDGAGVLRPDGVREISRADLFEVSVVAIAANPATATTGVKSFSWRELEDVLRQRGGLSARQAKRFVAEGRRAVGDATDEPETLIPNHDAIAAALAATARKFSR